LLRKRITDLPDASSRYIKNISRFQKMGSRRPALIRGALRIVTNVERGMRWT
jgi:hypothetical protein